MDLPMDLPKLFEAFSKVPSQAGRRRFFEGKPGPEDDCNWKSAGGYPGPDSDSESLRLTGSALPVALAGELARPGGELKLELHDHDGSHHHLMT